MKRLIREFSEDKYKVLTFFLMLFLVCFSIYALKPEIEGDSLFYTESIQVLKTGISGEEFMPMMILTTYLGLRLIMFFDYFFQNIAVSWLVLDGLLYVTAGIFFYSLVNRIFNSSKVAFISTLFLMANYAAIVFGLGYLMDMGGWAAYIASLYFSWRYLEGYSKEDKWIYISSAVIGIGGLYKEYAFVAYVIVFGSILWSHWGMWKEVFKKVFITGVLSFTPFALMNVYTFFYYNGYTYWDWFNYQKVYEYQNRPVEFIKSFGSIYTFGWFLFLPGLYIILKRIKETLRDRTLVFIWLTIASSFSVILWPVVTRVLFITMPAIVLVTTLYINKKKESLLIVYLILLIYIVTCYLMDAFVLDFVNLPI